MEEELKPCPFCGSIYIRNIDNGMDQNLTGCDKCGARIYYKFNSLSDAKKVWNTRPLEDELRAQLDEKQRIIDIKEKRIKKLKSKLERLTNALRVYDESYRIGGEK